MCSVKEKLEALLESLAEAVDFEINTRPDGRWQEQINFDQWAEKALTSVLGEPEVETVGSEEALRALRMSLDQLLVGQELTPSADPLRISTVEDLLQNTKQVTEHLKEVQEDRDRLRRFVCITRLEKLNAQIQPVLVTGGRCLLRRLIRLSTMLASWTTIHSEKIKAEL